MIPDPSLLVVPTKLPYRKKIRRVTILYNNVGHLAYGEKEDVIADEDTVRTALAINKALADEGFFTQLFELNEQNTDQLFELKTDLIFNLCYGINSIPKTEAEVVKILEQTGIPFTGAASRAISLTTDKAASKKKLSDFGIPTPKFQIFVSAGGRLDPKLHFPLIVKPKNQDCSLGIRQSSVVTNISELRKRVDFIINAYKEPALVEQYIDGRELNVTIIGNRSNIEVLPTSEIVFGQSYKDGKKWKIVDFEAKWIEDSINFTDTPGVCPAKLNKETEKQVEEFAILAYRKCDCRDYARIDFRLSEDNIVYFLEVNLNPGIGPTDGSIRSAKAAGLSYNSFLKEIVHIAAARY